MEDPETYCADVTAWARSVPGSNRRYLDALETKVLVFDGAMGTSLQNQPLTKVHRSCLEVGVDVLETDAFRPNRITMKEYGLQDRVLEINEAAAKLARCLADEYSTAKHAKNAKKKEPKLCVIRSFRGFRVEGLAA